MIYYKNPSELYHHGILGQKWGVRRYQNPDGTLTDAGKKRYTDKAGSLTTKGRELISNSYKKAVNAGDDDLAKNYTHLYVKSYNKTADIMNNGGIDKYNTEQEKKYGENYMDRPGYVDDYDTYFTTTFEPIMNKALDEFILSNEHYQKAVSLAKTYDMASWDELAKELDKVIPHY